MRHLMSLCMAIVCALTITFSLQAQDQPPIAVLTFMDADDGGAYVDLETKVWKPMHAKRVDKGQILGWYLYAVVDPYDSGRKYNYMTVEVYPSWNSMEGAYSDLGEIASSIHPDFTMNEISMRTEKSRTLVKSTHWVRRDGVAKEGVSNKDVKYVRVDWMDVHPGHMGGYVDMEREVFKPVHKTRVDDGHILGWSLFTKVSGYSDRPGMDAATGASYASWEDLWNSYSDDAWERAHPGVDQDEMYEKMRKHRDMVGSTTFALIDYVEAEM